MLYKIKVINTFGDVLLTRYVHDNDFDAVMADINARYSIYAEAVTIEVSRLDGNNWEDINNETL